MTWIAVPLAGGTVISTLLGGFLALRLEGHIATLLVQREPWTASRVIEHRAADAPVEPVDPDRMASRPQQNHDGDHDQERSAQGDEPVTERESTQRRQPHGSMLTFAR